MLYFSIFFKRCNKPRVHFSPLDKKHKLQGNFEKILKMFAENSIEKLNFIKIFGKFVTKNRAFGNNTIFLQQIFRLGGGGIPPPSPLNPPLVILFQGGLFYFKGGYSISFRGLIYFGVIQQGFILLSGLFYFMTPAFPPHWQSNIQPRVSEQYVVSVGRSPQTA